MDGAFGVLLQYPDDHGEVRDLRPIIEKAHAAGAAGGGGDRPAGADAADAARRNGRGRRGRQLAALRRAARLRRSARRVLRDARVVRPPGARPDHRRVGRRARASRLPHGAADARAAHPPREGDVEHLHRAGAARQHGRDVRGVSRARGAEARSPRGSTTWRARVEDALAAHGLRQTNAAYFDTLRIEGANVAGGAARRRAAAASTSATSRTARSASRVDETTTDRGRRRHRRGRSPAGQPAPSLNDDAPVTSKAPSDAASAPART